VALGLGWNMNIGVWWTPYIVAVAGQGPQAAPDERNLRSPETYVGYAQTADFASPGGLKFDVRSVYRTPPALAVNHWSLAGAWMVDALTMALADPQPPLGRPLFEYAIASRNVQLSATFLPPESEVTKIVIAVAGVQLVIAAAVSKRAKCRFMGVPLA